MKKQRCCLYCIIKIGSFILYRLFWSRCMKLLQAVNACIYSEWVPKCITNTKDHLIFWQTAFRKFSVFSIVMFSIILLYIPIYSWTSFGHLAEGYLTSVNHIFPGHWQPATVDSFCKYWSGLSSKVCGERFNLLLRNSILSHLLVWWPQKISYRKSVNSNNKIGH